MKIKFWCDNGANIHSNKTDELEWYDEDWNSMKEDEKYEAVREWAIETSITDLRRSSHD
jgi:hypothetical protein